MREADASGSRPVALYRTARAEPGGVGLIGSGFGMQRIRRWIENRTLPEFAGVLVEAGAGWLETPRHGRQRILAPALFWLLPGERHSYGPDEGAAWRERWVLFTGTLAEAFVAAGLIDPERLVLPVTDPAPLLASFARLHSAFLDDGPLAGAAIAAELHRLVVAAAQLGRAASAEQRPGDIDIATARLREAAFTSIDFAALARAAGVSPATLRRQMIARHGVPPKVLQRELRLTRAKELLAASALPIEVVARAVGYDDAYYFSRVFARHEGLPPSEFRRQNQRG